MKDMFHSAALKLTSWYLGIILLLSLSTSLALYHVSSVDLERNALRQINYYSGFLSPGDIDDYSQLRQNQVLTDRSHLKGNLVLFNFLVLVVGGIGSYALARRTLRPIEESLDSQARFAGDASHELRTPLTAMQSEIEVALRDSRLSRQDAIALLQSNLEEVVKLRALSEGLLKLTNASNGDEDLDHAVSVKDVVKQATERVDKMAAAKKIKINAGVKDYSVRGNHQHLVDLVAILLDNAIKYSPRGSQVKISSVLKDKKIRVSIKDEGIGIKASDLPSIFERFYRADTSRAKATGGGYGLGLALAKKIADLHHGAIEVSSAPGKGSVFTISLPAA